MDYKEGSLEGQAHIECDTPGCIRPHHMDLETHQEVMVRARAHLNMERPARSQDQTVRQGDLSKGGHTTPRG